MVILNGRDCAVSRGNFLQQLDALGSIASIALGFPSACRALLHPSRRRFFHPFACPPGLAAPDGCVGPAVGLDGARPSLAVGIKSGGRVAAEHHSSPGMLDVRRLWLLVAASCSDPLAGRSISQSNCEVQRAGRGGATLSREQPTAQLVLACFALISRGQRGPHQVWTRNSALGCRSLSVG